MGNKKYANATKVWAVHEADVTTIRGLITWEESEIEAVRTMAGVQRLRLKRLEGKDLAVSPLIGEQLDVMMSKGNMGRPLPHWKEDK
jgi:hypothetical protein